MFSGTHIPIKYKFLGVILFIMFMSLGVFFYFTYTTFSEDKKLFVMDLNMTLLKAATSEIKLELKSRLEVLQVLVPRVYNPTAMIATGATDSEDPFTGLPEGLKDEILGVTFIRRTPDKRFEISKQWRNSALFAKRAVGDDLLAKIAQKHPLPLDGFLESEGNEILNRSIAVSSQRGNVELSIVSFMVTGTFINDESKETIIVVDLLQDFLRKKLQQSEIAEVFLVYKKGSLLSHPNASTTVTYSATPYPHPIVPRLAIRQLPRESLELDIENEAYLCNVGETGFKDIYAVSQIRKSEAFLALRTLLEKSILIALVILGLALVFSIVFASRLTSNIRKLKEAAEQIGIGHLRVKLNIRSNDEIQHVAESFQWMSNRLKQLIAETAEKARLEDELETARLVQSTLLTPPDIDSDAVDILAHYLPATECGGDFWDAYLNGNKLTVFIGDATGHGAPAAIVTAVAKSCFSTLLNIYQQTHLSPEQFMTILNRIIHESCKGKLLMTMCIIQIDLTTGELSMCNGGHESPLSVGGGKSVRSSRDDSDKKSKAVVLFARGERLGYNPDADYETARYQLNVGDTVMLYTDGVSEARDGEGKEWGERNLKKAFTETGGQSLTKMKDSIVEALGQHTGDAQQEDDVTFVLVNFRRQLAAPKAPPKREPPPTAVETEYKAEADEMTRHRIEELPPDDDVWKEGGDDDEGNQAA